MSENIYYTYAYLRKDGTPYYIGKGKNGRAYTKHKSEAMQPPKDHSRIIFLHKDCSENQALAFEIFWIAVYGRQDLGTGILRNRANGGEGSAPGPVTKRKMSVSAVARGPNQTGLKRTDKQRNNISAGIADKVSATVLSAKARLGGLAGKDKPKNKTVCAMCGKDVFKHQLPHHLKENCKKY